MVRYVVKRAPVSPSLDGAPGHPTWSHAQVGQITHFHARSSSHQPQVQFRVQYDDERLYVQFEVSDRYVRSVCTTRQGHVCKDSCVEFFVEPVPGKGYFNFEVNCGGTLLLWHVLDPTRTSEGLRKSQPVDDELCDQMQIRTSMPPRVEPELAGPVSYLVSYSVPFSLFEAYVGKLPPKNQQPWRANFYKCADATSHPHWGSWSPIGRELNFHQPKYFGELAFE